CRTSQQPGLLDLLLAPGFLERLPLEVGISGEVQRIEGLGSLYERAEFSRRVAVYEPIREVVSIVSLRPEVNDLHLTRDRVQGTANHRSARSAVVITVIEENHPLVFEALVPPPPPCLRSRCPSDGREAVLSCKDGVEFAFDHQHPASGTAEDTPGIKE